MHTEVGMMAHMMHSNEKWGIFQFHNHTCFTLPKTPLSMHNARNYSHEGLPQIFGCCTICNVLEDNQQVGSLCHFNTT